MTHRERFFATLDGAAPDRVPVFPLLMFLPADRAGITYRTFATDGAALADAQLRAQRRFGLDAITACSDAFRIAADLGGDMAYPEDAPPHLARPLVTAAAEVAALGHPDPTAAGSRMADRVHAVEVMARAVGEEVAVLGWVDMPFAEACSLCGVSDLMLLLADEPETAHALLEHLTALVIDFARAQAAAGAPMIGCGDAAASLVSPPMYAEFALPYEQRVIAALHDAGARAKLHICGDTRALLPHMAQSGADLLNVDHLVPLAAARDAYAPRGRAYKGNINPVDLLTDTPDAARARARRALATAAGTPYMLSAGCEIPAGVPDEVLEAFCRAPQDCMHTR